MLAKNNGFTGAAPEDLHLIALGGSDRRFYRVAAKNKPCIAMVSPASTDEQQSWLDINCFLQSCSIAVPEIYAHDSQHNIMLVEDAGGVSLYNALQSEKNPQDKIALYKQALTFLATMQVRATPQMQTCTCLKNRHFDYAAFRAETDYFIRSFLQEYCQMEMPTELAAEFHHLALTLSAEPTVFMHRDFQSQNIHLLNDRIMVIDFQSATAGTPHYDLVSLLKDAYVILEEPARNLLLQFYIEERSRLDDPIDDPDAFTRTFHLCGLQRNMQALAAFSYLGTHKKKTHFYTHIPAATRYLEETLEMIKTYPSLRTTIRAIMNQLPGLSKTLACTP